MKRKLIVALFMFILVSAGIYAAQMAETRSKERKEGKYETTKILVTATTGLDSAIVLNKDNVPVETAHFEVNRTIFTLQFLTAEATAANSDWDVLWQVSAVQTGLLNEVFPGETGEFDWTTVETDQNDNSVSWVATFDAAAYKGMRVRAVLAEADASADAAVAIELYFTYPLK